jgi:hypothetical protein
MTVTELDFDDPLTRNRLELSGLLLSNSVYRMTQLASSLALDVDLLVRGTRILEGTSLGPLGRIAEDARAATAQIRLLASDLKALCTDGVHGSADLACVAIRVCRMLEADLRGRVLLDWNISDTPLVQCGERALGQIVLNAVVHAARIAALGQHGAVSVRVGSDLSRSTGNVSVSVTGAPADRLDERKRRWLCACRHMTESVGATFEVSEPGASSLLLSLAFPLDVEESGPRRR